MANTVQFVDSIASSPTVLLDLNLSSGSYMVKAKDIDLSPPPIRRAMSSTLLADGELITGQAYSNRTLKLPLVLLPTATVDTAIAQMQLLNRLLTKPSILKLQLEGATAPVFFRTFAAPDYEIEAMRLLMLARAAVITLSIPAEPFTYGLKVTLGSVTINNDPTNGTNGCMYEIAGANVTGDVETPLFMQVTANTVITDASGRRQTVFATRRGGTPSGAPFFLSAEAMTTGTDTTLQSNDTAMIGAGSNYMRCTFGSQTGLVTRLFVDPVSAPYPAGASPDIRGQYRVFARVRANTGSSRFQFRLDPNVDGVPLTGPVTNYDPGTTGAIIRWADLDVIQYPVGYDPITDGFSGTLLPAKGMGLSLNIARVAGSGSIDIDGLLFVPADDQLAIVKWPSRAGPTNMIVDAAHQMVYGMDTGTVGVHNSEPVPIVGSLPYITPGVTNRIVILRDVSPGAGDSSTGGDVKTATMSITPYFWPRYLIVRPATT